MPLPLSKLNTKILAKVLTYAANAYVDAEIAKELTEYFRTGQFKGQVTVPKMRAQQLVGTKKNLTNSYLIGLIYCQHMINGLANITYAHNLKHLILTRHRKKIQNLWQQLADQLSPIDLYAHTHRTLFGSWLSLIFKNQKSIEAYAKTVLNYHNPIKLPEVIRACLFVQRQNIAHNHMTAKALRSGKPSPDPKITLLRQLAAKVSQPDVFIHSATSTLISAAKWDKKFILLLRLCYPKIKLPR